MTKQVLQQAIEEAIGALDPHDHFDIIAKLNEALNYIQAQTHVGHIHDTASAALGETK